jgi:hypothetical protein
VSECEVRIRVTHITSMPPGHGAGAFWCECRHMRVHEQEASSSLVFCPMLDDVGEGCWFFALVCANYHFLPSKYKKAHGPRS